jgi:hypothetical protein
MRKIPTRMDICAETKPGEPWLYCTLWAPHDGDHFWAWKPEAVNR